MTAAHKQDYYCLRCGSRVQYMGFYRCTGCGSHLELGELTWAEDAARIRSERAEGLTCDPLF